MRQTIYAKYSASDNVRTSEQFPGKKSGCPGENISGREKLSALENRAVTKPPR